MTAFSFTRSCVRAGRICRCMSMRQRRIHIGPALSNKAAGGTDKHESAGSSVEAHKAVLDLLDPGDAGMALDVFRRAAPTWSGSSSSAHSTSNQQDALEPEAVHACNALLVSLAKSNTSSDMDKVGYIMCDWSRMSKFAEQLRTLHSVDHGLISKAFEYLSRMRSAFGRGIPSMAARNELIRGCGRALVRLRKAAEAADREPSPSENESARRYVELAEGLWREVFISSGPLSPLHSGERGADGQEAAARQLHGLGMALSSMIYVYCQGPAHLTKRAMEVFETMLEKNVKPDPWAAAGLVKALTAQGDPLAAMALIDRLQRDHGLYVHPHVGMYVALVSKAIECMARRPTLQTREADEAMLALATHAMDHMRRQGLPVTRRVWQRLLVGEARLGRWQQIEAHLDRMRSQGLDVTQAEWAHLVIALGVAQEAQRLDETTDKIRGNYGGAGLSAALYVSLVRAYSCCAEEDKVKQLRVQMAREGIRLSLHQYTAMVKGLEDAGMHKQAWEVFQECRDRGNRPDVVLYSVAMRTAAALDQGIEKMETVYHDFLAQGHRPDLLMLNSLMAGYAGVGRIDEAYGVLQTIRETKGLQPGMDTYNVLIHALSRLNRTDEALAIAEEAKRAGLAFDAFTRKGLAQGPAGMLLSMATTEDREGGGDKEGEGSEGGRVKEEEGGTVLVLDVHGLTVLETQTMLSRRLRDMREEYEVDRNAGFDKEEGMEGQEEEGGEAKGELEGRLRDLVVVTGFRARQKHGTGVRIVPGEAVLKVAVREFLQAREIGYYHPHHNGGRFVVPRASLYAYFDRRRKEESELRFMRLTLMRYIPVASLLLLTAVLPRLAVHYT